MTKELRAAHSLIVLKDTDRDTKPDDSDPDDDNDGLSDIEEKKNGTNPLVKEVKPTPKVLGASTTATTSSALVDRVVDTATSIGNMAFEETEEMRLAADAYVGAKLANIEANIAARPTNTSESGTTSIQFRSFKDQVSDVGGLLDSAKYYALKCIGFIVGSIYAFYLFLIAVVLLVLRKIWRRHSLD